MADEIEAVAGAAAAAAPAVAPVPEPLQTTEGKDWAKGALILAGGGAVDSAEKRPVIMCEARNEDGTLGKVSYPLGADLYYRHGDPATALRLVRDKDGNVVLDENGEAQTVADAPTFPDKANVRTLGAELEQGLLAGFSRMQGIVHVGPAHPAYAAANLAFLMGAKDIEVRGLPDIWKARLKPWFDGVVTDRISPAPVKVTLT